MKEKLKDLNWMNFGGVYKFATLSKHHEYYQRMVEQNENSLSNAALETLAIIAYNQPNYTCTYRRNPWCRM